MKSIRRLHAPQRGHVHLEAAQPRHLCQVGQPARRVDRVGEEATGGAAAREVELGHLDEVARERQAEAGAQPRAQDAPRARTPREAHALERAQRRHVGVCEGVLEGVLVDELF